MNQNPKNIKWGIIGLGKIAHKFAQDLQNTDNCELASVASRTLVKAETFAMEYGVAHAFGSYEELASSPEIQAVYVATPHIRHKDDAILCLQNGKAVLCEKPLAMNLEEVNVMIAVAKTKNRLLMEALWTRFLPSFQFVKEKIDLRQLGAIKSIEADFGFIPAYNPEDRLFNKSLGGGSLLDIGIYPMFLALSLLGKPEKIHAEATFFDTGADSSVDMALEFSNGIKANLKSTLLEDTPTTAIIECEKGNLILNSRFHEPTSVTIESNGDSEVIKFETENHGYNYEIEHFNDLLRSEKTQSDLMPHEFSKLLSRSLDKVKRQIGLSYP